MQFPLMDIDAGLGGQSGQDVSQSVDNTTLSNVDDTSTQYEVIDSDTALGNNTQRPQHIPYERFSEVVQDRNSAQAQLQQLIGIVQQQQQQLQQVQVAQQPQADPYELLARFQENPEGFLAERDAKVLEQAEQRIMAKMQAQQTERQAFNSALEKYPEFKNNPQLQSYMYRNALDLAQQVAGNPAYAGVTAQQIFEFSAKEISDVLNSTRTAGQRDAQGRLQQRADAFVEGAGNLAPQQKDSLLAQMEKAKADGDAALLMKLKLQRMQAQRQQ